MNNPQEPAPPLEAGDAGELQLQIHQLQARLKRQETKRGYRELQERIVDFIHLVAPRGSTVLVVSRGDDYLLDVSGRRGWHFPRAADGLFAGCYPADSKEAIEHLRKLSSAGADYLAIPSTSFWWLEFYRGFARHLQRRHRLVGFQEEVCLVFKLIDDTDNVAAAMGSSNGHSSSIAGGHAPE